METKLVEILSLKPEDKQRLHSYALKRFDDWRDCILSKAPQLRQLSIEQLGADLNAYLNANEMVELNNCLDDVIRWLAGCMDAGDGYFPYAYDTQVITPMSRVEYLIMKAYRAKEDEEEWNAACKAVNPPLSNAKRYLNDKEYDKFTQAVLEAIEVYLEKGEDYLDDMRTFDYRRYLKNINDRKEKEKQKIATNITAKEYNQRLNKEKARLKALLCPNRKDHESYFKKQIKDRCYTGQSFAQFLSSEEKQDFDKTIADISRKKLDEIVSSDFRQFIDRKCWRSYFLLPSAEYSLEEVSCLDFIFDVFAVVETGVWLKPRQKNFGDYIFKLPWREEKGCSVLLQEPEFLGYHYLVLTPEDLGGDVFWESIPLVLLKWLLNGDTKPSGFTISAASDTAVTYQIPKFKEEVTIPDSFAGYLRSVGGIDAMVSIGYYD